MKTHEIDTPALVLDLKATERNIERMAALAAANGKALRPHTKTHKLPPIAHMQVRAGAVGIVVAKVGEAEVMAASGIRDILVAYPLVTESKIERLVHLAKRVNIKVTVDGLISAEALSCVAKRHGVTLDVLIEVDCGFNRCGVMPGGPLVEFAAKVSKMPGLAIRGLLTYPGHVSNAMTIEDLHRVSQEECDMMSEMGSLLRQHGHNTEILSGGSSPTARLDIERSGLTEVRPGRYVFNDAKQVAFGEAREKDCSLTVLATVVSLPSPDRAIIDTGTKCLSMEKWDSGLSKVDGWAKVKGRTGLSVFRISEEHGIVSIAPGQHLELGEKLRLIPNHVCTVVNLFDKVHCIVDDEVEAVWPISGRGKVR